MLKDRYLLIIARIIATLLLIYLAVKVNFLFAPVTSLIYLCAAPFVTAGFLFYALRSIILYTDKRGWKRPLVILLLYALAAAGLAGLSIWLWPTLKSQTEQFITEAPSLLDDLKQKFFSEQGMLSRLLPKDSDLPAEIGDKLSQLLSSSVEHFSNVISFLSQFVIILTTVPLILYYMLKNGDKLPERILDAMPFKFRENSKQVLHETDSVLSKFIVGRVIVTGIMSILLIIGFLIIGLPNALLLTLIAAILNFIPYIGPILSGIPIGLVGLSESPMTAFWALLVLFIAQQLEENWFTPVIFGKNMDIHPLTTVVVVLIGADLAGIIGLLLSIPVYMVLKIAMKHIYEVYLVERYQPEQLDSLDNIIAQNRNDNMLQTKGDRSL